MVDQIKKKYRVLSGNHKVANQNYREVGLSDDAVHSETLKTLAALFSKINGHVSKINGHVEEIKRSQDRAENRVQQTIQLMAECRDAWESNDLASMIEKRDHILDLQEKGAQAYRKTTTVEV